MKVCIVGASGKLGLYMLQHCLDRGYDVVGVCRERSVSKLNAFKDRITIVPGAKLGPAPCSPPVPSTSLGPPRRPCEDAAKSSTTRLCPSSIQHKPVIDRANSSSTN